MGPSRTIPCSVAQQANQNHLLLYIHVECLLGVEASFEIYSEEPAAWMCCMRSSKHAYGTTSRLDSRSQTETNTKGGGSGAKTKAETGTKELEVSERPCSAKGNVERASTFPAKVVRRTNGVRPEAQMSDPIKVDT